jgi:hypothetical protein
LHAPDLFSLYVATTRINVAPILIGIWNAFRKIPTAPNAPPMVPATAKRGMR